MGRKASINIGRRALEEVDRLYPVRRRAMEAIGCSKNTFEGWEHGHTPTPIFFERLYHIGADIPYILTGSRDTVPIELIAALRSNPNLLNVAKKVATLDKAQLNSLESLLSSFGCGDITIKSI